MLKAILVSTTLDLASGQLTCTVGVSLGAFANDYPMVISSDRLVAQAQASGRSDWSTDDVLALLSQDAGTAVTAAQPIVAE